MKPTSKVTVRDPFSGKVKTLSIDRTGHTEQKLIVSLADPKTTREQKDHALSMYLFERGNESMSFITDLFRYKGEHTKESRVFQSRMRFDFESFVSSFVIHLESQAVRMGKMFGVDIYEEKKEFENWLELPNNKRKGCNYREFYSSKSSAPSLENREKVALVEAAIYDIDEAQTLQRAVDNITKARMAEKGYGIYIDKDGKPYSVNDPILDQIIAKDREILREAEE